MGSRSKNSRTVIHYSAFLFLATLVLFCFGLYSLESVSEEAMIREAIRRQITLNSTEGRQALVGSAWWGPLPSLLGLPFSLLFSSRVIPASSLFVSALMGAASLILLHRALHKWKVSNRILMVFLFAMAVNPVFLRECVNGSSATTSLFFTVLVAYGLTDWIDSRNLRTLVYFGFASGMLILSDFNMAMWVLVAFLLMGIDLISRKVKPRQREGVLIMALTPLAYITLLWMLMNWLIMGDGFYFLRSLGGAGIRNPSISPAGLLLSHKFLGTLSFALAVVCAVAKQRGGFYLGFLGVMPLVLAHYLTAKGFFWDPVPLLFCIFPLSVLLLGRLAGMGKGLLARPAMALALIPVVVSLSMFIPFLDGVDEEDIPRVSKVDHDLIRQVAQHVLTRSRASKVYVCGYDGFLLTEAAESSLFVNALDFNFYKARNDYWGYKLYLLMRKPDGRSAMESIHWKFDGIYEFGESGTLHDGNFGEWRLYEIIQPPS